jgi:hypothetical protein
MSRYARRQSVKAVAARSAGALSTSLDAAKAISDLAATRSQLRSGRDARFIARPPHRTVRAAFPHTAPTSGV